jgi:hypothetical protein
MRSQFIAFMFVAACSSSRTVNPPQPPAAATPDPVAGAPASPQIDITAMRGRCQSAKHGVDQICEPPFDFEVGVKTVAACYWSRGRGQFRLDVRGATGGEQISLVVDGFTPDAARPTQTLTVDPATDPPGHLSVAEVLPQNGCKSAGTQAVEWPAAPRSSSPCQSPCTVTLVDSDPAAAGARPFDITISCPQLCVDNTAYVCKSLAGGGLQFTTRQTCEPSS